MDRTLAVAVGAQAPKRHGVPRLARVLCVGAAVLLIGLAFGLSRLNGERPSALVGDREAGMRLDTMHFVILTPGFPDSPEGGIKVWLAGDCYRQETTFPGEETEIVVCDGEREWKYEAGGQWTYLQEPAEVPSLHGIARLVRSLYRGELLDDLRAATEDVTIEEVQGPGGVAVERLSFPYRGHGTLTLAVDRVRGRLVSLSTDRADWPEAGEHTSFRVADIEYGLPLPASLFAFAPGDETQVAHSAPVGVHPRRAQRRATAADIGLDGLEGRIVFVRGFAGERGQLWLGPPANPSEELLLDTPQRVFRPVISPDGRMVAFQSTSGPERERDMFGYSIYTMPLEPGAEPTRLTKKGRNDNPTWSPDGTRIAFCSFRDGNWEIYVMNADGTDQQRLTHNTWEDSAPSWSPDGERLAFVCRRTGEPEVMTMPVRVSGDEDAQNVSQSPTTTDAFPAWSPDGARIVFCSSREGNWGIYVADADGGNVQPVVETPGQHRWPRWSPDGQWIAFESCLGSPPDPASDLYITPAPGATLGIEPGTIIALTQTGDAYCPSWHKV